MNPLIEWVVSELRRVLVDRVVNEMVKLREDCLMDSKDYQEKYLATLDMLIKLAGVAQNMVLAETSDDFENRDAEIDKCTTELNAVLNEAKTHIKDMTEGAGDMPKSERAMRVLVAYALEDFQPHRNWGYARALKILMGDSAYEKWVSQLDPVDRKVFEGRAP